MPSRHFRWVSWSNKGRSCPGVSRQRPRLPSNRHRSNWHQGEDGVLSRTPLSVCTAIVTVPLVPSGPLRQSSTSHPICKLSPRLRGYLQNTERLTSPNVTDDHRWSHRCGMYRNNVTQTRSGGAPVGASQFGAAPLRCTLFFLGWKISKKTLKYCPELESYRGHVSPETFRNMKFSRFSNSANLSRIQMNIWRYARTFSHRLKAV